MTRDETKAARWGLDTSRPSESYTALREYVRKDAAGRPIMLDLFSGRAGGAAEGYMRAGWYVIGVDIAEPYDGKHCNRFSVCDWLEGLYVWGAIADAVHASPPCQGYTTMSAKHRGKGTLADERTQLIPAVRAALEQLGKPYVIENVPGAKRAMRRPVTLHGRMFGLRVNRPRLFECGGWSAVAPARDDWPGYSGTVVGVYGKRPDGRKLWTRKDGSVLKAASSVAEGAAAMGWPEYEGEWRGLADSLPPVYTHWLGRQLANVVHGA